MNSSFKELITISVFISVQFLSPSNAWAVETLGFEKFIPQGTLVKEKTNELKVKTISGTIVEIEFSGDGAFKEASGDAAISGDVFIPGMSLLSLKEATEALSKLGKVPTGEWSLEKGFLSGWSYEFEGKDNERKMEYKLDAKTGQLLKEEEDD